MSFDVISPAGVEEALDYMDRYQPEIQPLAGGTNALVDFKRQKIKPQKVLDLSNLIELQKITLTGSILTIGPLVTHATLHCHPLLNSAALSMVSQAAGMVGGPAIRNRGTVGGNIQSASPAADVVVPLLALDAKLVLASKGGKRQVPMREFLLGPGKTDKKPEELITAIFFEYPVAGKSIFSKLGQRNALAISVVSLAVQMKFSDRNEITKVAIALGSVAPTAVRARNSEEFLLGKVLTEETITIAKDKVLEDIKTITDVRATSEYRNSASQALLARSLHDVMPVNKTS